MKKSLLTLLCAICCISTFAQVVYTGSLKSTDPMFARPDEGTPPTAVSIIGTSVFYNIIPVNILIPGMITFTSNSAWDNFIILYGPGGFNPEAPLNNALLANDDFGGPSAGFTYTFPAAGMYYLVICSFKNDVTGAYVINQAVTIVLPLKLISFTAGKAGSANAIKWISAGERDVKNYQVQRSSDGNNFSDLESGSLLAKNTNTAAQYSFTDGKPGSGYNYYRLKITEGSGNISYSPVALVKNSASILTNIHVFPNPSVDYLKVEVKSMQNVRAAVSIINAAGITLQNEQSNFNSQGVLTIDTKRLPAGKYFLKTVIGPEQQTSVFIKN